MVRWRLPIGLVLLLMAAACGGPPTNPGPIDPPPPTPSSPPPPAPTPVLGVTRILAFGDSLTAGTTSPPLSVWALDVGLPQSYVFKLRTLLTQRYSGQVIEVFNGGFAGKRASEDRGRLIDALRETRPEVLLLLEGANDLNQENGRDQIGPTIGALEELIGEGTSRGARVFIATLPPQRIGGKSLAAGFIPEFNTQVRRMAPDEGATLVDIFAGMQLEQIGQDGLHPTEAGYQRMAEIWFDALRTAFEQPPQASGRTIATN
jgi:lysophospholipase L1-like esterase